MIHFRFLLLLLVLAACSGTGSKNENPADVTDTVQASEDAFSNDRYFDLSSYITNVPVDPAAVQVIDSTCAIIINPTPEQMAAMQTEYGDEFESVADDAFFYMGNALSVIDSAGVRTIDAQPVSHLKLIGSLKTYTLSIRKNGLPEWNIIFFHRNKEPQVISALDLTVEKTQQYFSDPK